MRSLLTLIVIPCSLTEEKLLSLELQSKVILNCGNTILVDNTTMCICGDIRVDYPVHIT